MKYDCLRLFGDSYFDPSSSVLGVKSMTLRLTEHKMV